MRLSMPSIIAGHHRRCLAPLFPMHRIILIPMPMGPVTLAVRRVTSRFARFCELYFPLSGGGVRGPDGCPPHYKRHGALCKPNAAVTLNNNKRKLSSHISFLCGVCVALIGFQALADQ